ncbi:MAG: ABC transporter permease [Deltaproteobacteria bacterium]|nr:ABC transporter permease [Deltaproteobacteria bacterium]
MSDKAQNASSSKRKIRRGSAPDFVRRLFREKPMGAFGGMIFLILLITGIFADFLAPYHYNAGDISMRFYPPSPEHILGTDELGRDIFSRIIYGAQLSLIVGFSATAIATIISTIIGITTGYIGGKFDMYTQRFVDAWMCLPPIVVLMVLVSIVGAGIVQLILILGIIGSIGASRITRSVVITVKESVYVKAAEAIGVSTLRILTHHILPNIMYIVIVGFSMAIAGNIMAEATLSFLGMGIPAPYPSWGGMLSGPGRKYLFHYPMLSVWPGLALTIVVFGINMFGDAVNDLLDPSLRGGIGSYSGESEKRSFVRLIKKLFK